MNPAACYSSATSGFKRAVIVYALVLLTPAGQAEESVKVRQCAKADVRLIRISVDYGAEALRSNTPQIIEITSGQTSETTSNAMTKTVPVIAVGPVLGSMDSREIETRLECTTNGFALTAIITRSAGYNGSLAQNVNWRPRIELTVLLKKPEAFVRTTWKMRLTTGAELNHAQTPPYPEQKYPITAVKKLQ